MWYQPTENRKFTLHSDIRAAFTNTSFPSVMDDSMLALFGIFPLRGADIAAYDEATHKIVAAAPELIDGEWVDQVSVVAMTPDEQHAFAVNRLVEVVEAVQARLDSWAKERNYDGILSLCTYATSSIPKFAAEGQSGVEQRDATWTACYTLLGEYQSGSIPLPTVSDVLNQMPQLSWPA